MPSPLLCALQRQPAVARLRRRRAAKRHPVATSGGVLTPEPSVSEPKPRRSRTPRSVTMSSLLRQRESSRREVLVPYLRLSGSWLEECGFPIGATVSMKAEQGRLILTNEEVLAGKVATKHAEQVEQRA